MASSSDQPPKPAKPTKKRFNRSAKRALKAASVQNFLRKYGRVAQRGVEPNDRRYDRKVEKEIKQMRPEELDHIIRDDEE